MKQKLIIIAFLIILSLNVNAGSITGFVTDSNNNPLNNVNITLNDFTTQTYSGFNTTTDSTGFYSLNYTVANGMYTLNYFKLGYTNSPKNKVIDNTLNYTNISNSLNSLNIGTLSINVKNNTLNNLANALVTLINSTNISSSYPTDINGNLTFNYVQPGTYTVIASSAPNYYDSPPTTVVISSGSTTNVNIILSNIPPIPPTPPGSPNGGGGGGGGGCTPKWNCTEWNSCNKNANQTRICTDLRDCFNSDNKPLEVQSCAYLECTKDSDCLSGYECKSNKCTKKIIIENKTATQETEEITETNAITGFSILDYAKKFKDSKAATIVLAVFLGSLAGIAVFTYLKRKY